MMHLKAITTDIFTDFQKQKKEDVINFKYFAILYLF